MTSQRRTEKITLYLSPSELADLNSRAAATGQTLLDYIRQALSALKNPDTASTFATYSSSALGVAMGSEEVGEE